jgi:hypothetical protein
MSSRLVRLLLKLYPRRIRDRYGHELLDLSRRTATARDPHPLRHIPANSTPANALRERIAQARTGRRRLLAEELGNHDAFVMGRVTYERLRANWGSLSGNPYIDRINAMPKCVASRSLAEATWNATLLGPDAQLTSETRGCGGALLRPL